MATITKVNSINRRKTVIKRKEDIVVTNKHTVLQSGSQPLKRMVFKGKYIKINVLPKGPDPCCMKKNIY